MADESNYLSEEEVVAELKATKAAIEEGLANLGVVEEDEVSGFQFTTGFSLPVQKVEPQLVQRLGPRFHQPPTDLAAVNGHCGIIC